MVRVEGTISSRKAYVDVSHLIDGLNLQQYHSVFEQARSIGGARGPGSCVKAQG
jgi:hypothetical protein